MHRELSMASELSDLVYLNVEQNIRYYRVNRAEIADEIISERVSRPARRFKCIAEDLAREGKLVGSKLYYWRAIRTFERLASDYRSYIEDCKEAIEALGISEKCP